ncbi:hypothetical protein INT45_013731 [Circinella minor]|uniref:Uncharacterized protein n=1 Tax=Circinella minor TaxID=1195481 RepID=A0A8H7VM22_9FUNG|nr:hypothetical protein INT45_013731 [Circinella minor]
MRLPIQGGGEATFFGELILFFTHRFRDAQPPVTLGSIQERFEGMSQSDKEMEVIESAETMEGVEEKGILDERPLCLVKLFGNLKMTDYGTKERKKKGLPYGPRGGPNTPDKLCVIDAENIWGDITLGKISDV